MNVPKIRFPEFSGEWEEKKIKDIFSERLERSSYGELISVTINSGVIRASEFDRKDNSSEDKSNYKLVNKGDIAYNSMRMWQGASGYSSFDGILSPAYTVLVPKESISSKFFSYKFKQYNMIQKFKRNSQGMTSDTWNLKFKQLGNIKVFLPSFQEQQKIGNFFKKLDESISLQKNKIDNLKLQKKSLLQKMFPKNGETIPEIRFPEFSGEWEEKKLGEVAYITMGQSPSSTNYTDNPNDYILVQGNTDIKNGHVFPRVWTTQVTKIAEKGDLILSVRAPVGDIGKTSYNVVLGRGVAGIKGNEFIFQTLVNLKSIGYWNKISTGSTFESINSSYIKNTYIHIPTLLEQQKIGNFFKKLDTLILLNQQKLENLEKRKKGLLQKMFV